MVADELDHGPLDGSGTPRGVVRKCIDACLACAQACTACADAGLLEPHLEARTKCIRLSLDCADVCGATARVLTRQTLPDDFAIRTLVLACAAVTAATALECLEHDAPEHERCRTCAEACRACERACLALAKESVG